MKDLEDIFNPPKYPKDLFGLFEKCHYVSINCCGYFISKFCEKWAISIPSSGHSYPEDFLYIAHRS